MKSFKQTLTEAFGDIPKHNTFYHITPRENGESIAKEGLKANDPHTHTKTGNPDIGTYLYSGRNPRNNLVKLYRKIASVKKRDGHLISKQYSIFRVNMKNVDKTKLKSDQSVRYYRGEPERGFWHTPDNIPPEAIKLHHEGDITRSCHQCGNDTTYGANLGCDKCAAFPKEDS